MTVTLAARQGDDIRLRSRHNVSMITSPGDDCCARLNLRSIVPALQQLAYTCGSRPAACQLPCVCPAHRTALHAAHQRAERVDVAQSIYACPVAHPVLSPVACPLLPTLPCPLLLTPQRCMQRISALNVSEIMAEHGFTREKFAESLRNRSIGEAGGRCG